jgi:selenocysteine-specific elongation factor
MTSLVVGTAGHIDHGKSALVKALTGTDPDRLKEEQARGITIDLGFAHARIGEVEIAFVDVPGHERFVRNMLAGAGGIDAVMLVVAADESVRPQTREHFAICRLLGIRRGLVALTKCDLVDADTRDLAALDASELLAGSPLEGVPVVPVSARTGAGLDALRQALAALAGGAPRQAREGVARYPVDRVFTVKGFGTVVTGTLVSGEIAEGSELQVLPDGRLVRARGLQVHGNKVARVAAPQRVAVNLGSVDAASLTRGVTLVTPRALAVTRRVDLRVELLADARPLRHGARVRMHHGTGDVPGRVSIAALRSASGDPWTPVSAGTLGVEVPPGGEAFVRLRLDGPAVLTRNDLVVLRALSPAVTIAGGRVLDPEPPAGGVRRDATCQRFVRLDSEAGPADVWAQEAAGHGIDAADLVRRGGLSPAEAAQTLAALVERGAGLAAGARVFDRQLADAMGRRLVDLLAAHHARHPLDAGMPREAARESAAPGASAELFADVLRSLAVAGRITGADRLALAGHRAALSDVETGIRTGIEAAAATAGLAALDGAGLARAAGCEPAQADAVLSFLAREGRLVRLDGLYVDRAALDRLRADVALMAASAAPSRARLDVATFKARYGLTRKHAIPLLEWLDRERLTRRVGDVREVIASG